MMALIHDVDVAISLMREALAILDAPQNVLIAEQLRKAIDLAESEVTPAQLVDAPAGDDD